MRKTLNLFWVLLLASCLLSPAHATDEGHADYKSGVFAYEDGAYQEAEEALKRALAFDPENPMYHHYLGKTYLKMERYDDAARHLTRVQMINPNIPEFAYDWGFLSYQQGNYAEAAKHFREAVKRDPENALAHYHTGMSFFKQKRYGRAISYLLKSVEMSPVIRTGVSYWNTGRVRQAVEKFEYVRDHAETEELKANALNWLQTAKTEKPKKVVKPYDLYLKLGYQYDSNVRLEPLDRDDLYADEDDSVFEGYFSGAYHFINEDHFKLGAGYSHYQTWHNKLTQYNLMGSIFDFYTTYRFDLFTFGLTYNPSLFWVGEESYLARHKLTPELTWQIRNDLFTRFSYSFFTNDYSDSDIFEKSNDRDGYANGVSVDTYYNIPDNWGYVFGGLEYEANSADRSYESYGLFHLKLGVSLNLPWETQVNLLGKYSDKTHDGEDSRYRVKRDDGKYFCALTLSRKLYYDWLGILAEFDYTKNDSNIKDYEYERNVMSVSLTASY